jgi:hypothetical protein
LNWTTIFSADAAARPARARDGALRGAVLFLGLFCLLLVPAAINGFPLVMDDSIAYSGEGAHWMRPKTAAVAAALFYEHLGYWSLPLLNALLVAAAWTSFVRSFELGAASYLALPLSALALTPLYASAVLVDVWFLAAVLFGAVAMKRSSFALAVLAGAILSSHGSGAPLFVVFGLCAAIAFRRPRLLAVALVSAATAVAVNAALDARYSPGVPRLEKTFLSSRLFSADPELLVRECQRSGKTVLCEGATLIAALKDQPEHSGRRDFHWDMARRFSPAFDLAEFEAEHATPIILDAATSKPFETAALVMSDFFSFYFPETRSDFIAGLSEPMPEAFARSRQAARAMESAPAEGIATTLRYLLYLTVICSIALNRNRLGAEGGRWIAVLLLLCLANDLLFAVLSGPPDRYHHRVLGLLAAASMLAVRRDATGDPSVPARAWR